MPRKPKPLTGRQQQIAVYIRQEREWQKAGRKRRRAAKAKAA